MHHCSAHGVPPPPEVNEDSIVLPHSTQALLDLTNMSIFTHSTKHDKGHRYRYGLFKAIIRSNKD